MYVYYTKYVDCFKKEVYYNVFLIFHSLNIFLRKFYLILFYKHTHTHIQRVNSILLPPFSIS